MGFPIPKNGIFVSNQAPGLQFFIRDSSYYGNICSIYFKMCTRLCCTLLWLYYQFSGDYHDPFNHIPQGCVTGAIIWLLKGVVKMSQLQTITRHNKAWTVCIIIGTKNLVTISEMWIHMIHLPISFRVASLPLGQSYDCPSGSEATLKDMDKAEPITNITKHNKAQTMCIILGMYST